MSSFKDGIIDVFNGLMNKRNSVNTKRVEHKKLDDSTLREMYKSGLMSKIFRLKVGYSLNDTLEFESTADEDIYNERLAKEVKKAAKFMMGFGRGVILLFNKGDDLTKPLTPSPDLLLRTFSGDIVKGVNAIHNVTSERYQKPSFYNINGETVHWTRIVDFVYYEPVERQKPEYSYGGISESELVYAEFVNDSIVTQASSSIVEKASTFVYKIEGFKELIRNKKEADVVSYVSAAESGRSHAGALLTDKMDEVDVMTQTLADLDKVDDITLRRLSMVTGLGRTVLIGEQPSGMNANGGSERQGFQDTIENLQFDYELEPINYLAKCLCMGKIKFKENQGQTANDKALYDKTVAEVAVMMHNMGEDASEYLQSKGLVEKGDFNKVWGSDE